MRAITLSAQNPRSTSGGIDNRSLDSRIQAADAALTSCELCERRCGVNRRAGAPAPCRLGTETYCSKRYLSFTEEPELVPAVRVYLGGCNLRCRFCNTAPDCYRPRLGERVEPDRLASELRAAVDAGAKTVNLLGGEPSLHVHTILRIAAAGPALPLVLNTNAYMTPEALDLLDGVICVYLVDFKFGNNECARRLAGVSRYWEAVTRNLNLLTGRVSLRIRHLLIPGHLNCCFRPVVDWLSENCPAVPFRLMTSYVPGWRASSDNILGRLNAHDDVRAAAAYVAARELPWSTDVNDGR